MSGRVQFLQGVVDEWQEDWHRVWRPMWKVGKDGKYYPVTMAKTRPVRKDLDELDIATVR